MIKAYFNISILLFASWSVYGYCQDDVLLPMVAGSILVPSLLLRLKSSEKRYQFFLGISDVMIIILSFIGGLLWRHFVPVPPEVVSPFPGLTAALQSGTIFASVLIWLKPLSKKNMFHLIFLAWMTVAVSINVPFTDTKLFIFCIFCIIATTLIILHTMKKPAIKKYRFTYYRDYFIFSALIVTMTTGLFYGISRTLVVFDKVFMLLMNDYMISSYYSHFLNLDSRLNLISPGRSAWDKRPVLEVVIPETEGVYLKTQVFDTFDNGTWYESENITKTTLPHQLDPKLLKGEMMMFTSFKNIIPSPSGILAVRGNVHFLKDENDILYTEDKKRSRILVFSLTRDKPAVKLSLENLKRYKALPLNLMPFLKDVSNEIVGDQVDVSEQTVLIQDFFHKNFRYSLSVDFRADEQGIKKMIEEKSPAYCTYFATAMTLLMRAQGIPARMVTGFLTSEKIDKRKNKFLVRVKNAHAWTEALLPEILLETGEIQFTWQTIDATPSLEGLESAKKTKGIDWEKLTENLWLSLMRLGATIENIDKDKLKVNLLMMLVLTLLLINHKNMLAGLKKIMLHTQSRKPQQGKGTKFITSIYQRYEQYLKIAWGETRKMPETDAEVITRLKTRSDIPEDKISKIESFLYHYHAVRFGKKKNIDLEQIILSLKAPNE